jgi:hypothetical protein
MPFSGLDESTFANTKDVASLITSFAQGSFQVVAKDFVRIKTIANNTSVKYFIMQFSLSLQVTVNGLAM